MIDAVVFFKYRKELTDEEAEEAREEWDEIVENPPNGSEISLIADHAFGSNFNGFFVLKADNFEEFRDAWESIKDKIRWYTRTRTIIGIERE